MVNERATRAVRLGMARHFIRSTAVTPRSGRRIEALFARPPHAIRYSEVHLALSLLAFECRIHAFAPAHNDESSVHMSRRNGDRARFHKDRKRKLLHRQRIQDFVKARRVEPVKSVDAGDGAKS